MRDVSHTPASSDLRIGDRERAEAAERLTAHAAAGRLALEELEDRLARVDAAVVARDLAAVERDLPSDSQRAVQRPRRGWTAPVAIALLVVVGVVAGLLAHHPIAPPFIAAVLLSRVVLHPARRRPFLHRSQS
jgi:Flp pilus assembly protein TadB